MYCLFFLRYILQQLCLQVQRKITYTVLTYSSESDFHLPKEFIGSSFVMNVLNFLSFKKKELLQFSNKVCALYVYLPAVCASDTVCVCVCVRERLWLCVTVVYVRLCVCVCVHNEFVPTEDVITEALVILHLFLNKCKVSGIFTLTVHSLCRLV